MMYKFKDGDRILVTSEEEYKKLLSLLHEQGYEWANRGSLLDETECEWDYITEANSYKIVICIHKTKSRKRVTWNNTDIVPYSAISATDEPELTAVKAIRMQAEMCETEACRSKCPIKQASYSLCISCAHYCNLYPDKALKIINEYHYKKTLRNDFELAAQKCEELGCLSAAAELRKMQENINK